MKVKKFSENVLLYIAPKIDNSAVTITEFKRLQGYTAGPENYVLYWQSTKDKTNKGSVNYSPAKTTDEKIAFMLPPEMFLLVDTLRAEIHYTLNVLVDYFVEEIPINIVDNLQ